MKRRVKITALPKKQLPKADSGLYTKEKLTNNAFQFPVTFREGMKPGFDVKKRLGPVDRDKANIEAEVNETIITPMGDDAWTKSLPKTYVIGGKKHSKGGTPLSVPEGSFIFSDHLKERNQKIHQMLGKAAKKSGYTYAELSKPFMLNDDIRLLIDPDSDKITRETAELNIKNKTDKLGMIALLQESQKGFTDDEGNTDIPTVGIPYAEKAGLELDKAMDPFMQAIQQPGMEQNLAMNMQENQDLSQMQTGKYGGLVKMKSGGAVKKYDKGGGTRTLGADETVVFNSSNNRYEIINREGKVVGTMKVGDNNLKITRDQIPSNAIIIDRGAYKTDMDYQKARTEIYSKANGVPVVVKDGSSYKVLSQKDKYTEYKGEDLNTVFAGNAGIAAKYKYLEEKFNNPKVKAELSRRAIAALDNKDRRSSSMSAAEINALKKKLENHEFAYQQFMDMQKRNLATVAHQVKGDIKTIAEHKDDADAGKPTNKDFEDSWSKVGVKAPTSEEAKMQQALYWGYFDLVEDKKKGAIKDQDLLSAVDKFDIAQLGAKDPADLSGTNKGKISIIDGKYTNTTTGQVAWLGDEKEFVEGDLAPGEAEMKPNANKPEYVKGNPTKGWTAPDIMNYWGAVNEIYNDQPQEPYIATHSTYLPGVAIMSPEDMQQQIKGASRAQQDTLQSYSNRSSTAQILSGIQDSDQIASQTAQVHNANIQTINQHEAGKTQILNQAAANQANTATTLWDRWAQLKDNMQARKSAAKAEARKAFGIGETNEANYQAINLNTPNYQWDPFTQDFAGFVPGADITPTYNNKTTAADLFKEYRNQMPGVSDTAIAQLVKADMGIQDTPDYLNYSSGIPG